MTKVNFTTVPTSDMRPSLLDNLSVSIELSANQSASRSITFSLILENNTPEAIELINPYDIIAYTLTNEAGWPITLDTPPSRLVANAAESTTPFVNYRAEYLQVMQIMSGASDLPIDEELQKKKIVVAAQSAYHYIFQITTMVPRSDPPQNAGHQSNKTALTEGKYGISVILPLITFVANAEYSRIVQGSISGITLSKS